MSVESASARTPTLVSGPASMGIHGQSKRLKPPGRQIDHARTALESAPAANRMDRYAASRPERRSGATTASSRNAAAGSKNVVSASSPESVMRGPTLTMTLPRRRESFRFPLPRRGRESG